MKIGLFDSGLGGLTVLREVHRQIPMVSTEYFGDSGRAPYGGRGQDEIIKFSREILSFLGNKNIDFAIIACNTATAAALDVVKDRCDFPIMGMINPGVRAALAASKNKKIGIIATQFTINSRAYQKAIQEMDNDVKTIGQACQKFVSLVEKGKTTSSEAEAAVKEYLEVFKGSGIDTLVLGCTHFPVLLPLIEKYVDTGVKVVNPAVEVVRTAKELLESKIAEGNKEQPTHKFYTSGDVKEFAHLGGMILNQTIEEVEKVSWKHSFI